MRNSLKQKAIAIETYLPYADNLLIKTIVGVVEGSKPQRPPQTRMNNMNEWTGKDEAVLQKRVQDCDKWRRFVTGSYDRQTVGQ